MVPSDLICFAGFTVSFSAPQLVSTGQDVSAFYSDVVKNVVTQSVEVKKLVYTFLAQFAEVNQELALLSINSFQKDLADKNPLIRGLSLATIRF